MYLLEKYRPKKIEEIIGLDKPIVEFLKNLSKKPVLLYGPPGVGKTLSCYLVAKKLNLDLYEINASDYRDVESLKKVLEISKQTSIFGKKRLILIDEVDGLSSQDRGGSAEIIKILKESRNPVVLTANDAYDSKLRSIRPYCKLIPYHKIHSSSIVKYLKMICEKEGLDCEETTLKHIAQRSNGDVRASVLDLESLISNKKLLPTKYLSPRNFEENIFNSVRYILKTKKMDVAREVIGNLDRSPDDFFWWLEENVSREYQGEDLKNALNFLSLADIFRKRITKRQDWGLFRYYIDFISVGVALSKKEAYKKFVRYNFPTFISKMGLMKAKRNELNEKIEKLQETMHCSKRIIKEELPYLRQFLDFN
jgi:replication factor C large subunit